MAKKIMLIIIFLLLFSFAPLITRAADSPMLINELAWMGTEVSASDEWIELYNDTAETIDLTGWKLEAIDGSPSIALEGSIEPFGFFLLERTDDNSVLNVVADQLYTGALGNSGEHLKLFNTDNIVMDEINALTDGWPAGDNTTKQTMERTNELNWASSLEPGGTPKTVNSAIDSPPPADDDDQPPNTPPTPPLDDPPTAKNGDIVINEALPNPIGIDTKDEFIEIKNVSSSLIDLTGWQITITNSQIFQLPSLTMMPGSLVIFYRSQTNLALNNLKDTIKLKSTNNRIIDQLSYRPPVVPGKSFQRDENGKFHIEAPSPGEKNDITKKVLPVPFIEGPPEAQANEIITFDASDSFDPEGRALNFFWDFGDGRNDSGILVRQIYTAGGNYTVSLTVAAGDSASSTETLKIKIANPQAAVPEAAATNTTSTTTPLVNNNVPDILPFIFIAELLPDPVGQDTEGEFIELFNAENFTVDLSRWQLADASNHRPYTIPDGTTIGTGEYLAFFRPQTKIALNNTGDAVRLLSPDRRIADEVFYEKIKEGISLVRDELYNLQPSNTPTPDEINILDQQLSASTSVAPTSTPVILGASTTAGTPAQQSTSKKKYAASALAAVIVISIGIFARLRQKPKPIDEVRSKA